MKKTLLALLFLPTVPVFGATKANPADFTLKVHVVASGQTLEHSYQVLGVVIDNQPFQLTSGPYCYGLLPLGDYAAQIDPKVSPPKNDTVDVARGYVLLLPDGSIRRYGVTRIGPAPSHP